MWKMREKRRARILWMQHERVQRATEATLSIQWIANPEFRSTNGHLLHLPRFVPAIIYDAQVRPCKLWRGRLS